MKVVEKYVDMAKYMYNALKSYPKSEKYCLAADTRQALFKAGALLNRASDVPGRSDKARLLDQADWTVSDLKFAVRMGMELGFLPLNKYQNFSAMVTEVGKMLGGWLKFVRAGGQGAAGPKG
jgi:hypothetical protein